MFGVTAALSAHSPQLKDAFLGPRLEVARMDLGKDRGGLEEDCVLWTRVGRQQQRDRTERVRAFLPVYIYLSDLGLSIS